MKEKSAAIPVEWRKNAGLFKSRLLAEWEAAVESWYQFWPPFIVSEPREDEQNLPSYSSPPPQEQPASMPASLTSSAVASPSPALTAPGSEARAVRSSRTRALLRLYLSSHTKPQKEEEGVSAERPPAGQQTGPASAAAFMDCRTFHYLNICCWETQNLKHRLMMFRL